MKGSPLPGHSKPLRNLAGDPTIGVPGLRLADSVITQLAPISL